LKLLFILLFQLSIQSLFGQFTVTGDTLNGLTPERTVRMKQALELWQKVMRDTGFQRELQSLRYVFDVAGDQNRFLSSEEIATKIYQAREFYKDTADQCAQLHWVLDPAKKPLLARRPAIGFGESGDVEIHTYTWFFDAADLAELAGHIAHEWSHKIGFQHLYMRHKNRDKTVPYAFGNLVRKYAARL